jgi:hypothetical protein
MADRNLYWTLRGTFEEKLSKLQSDDKQTLIEAIIDQQYNEFLSDRSDYNKDQVDKHGGHGKRLPYIGWFWRHLNFSEKELPIGNCGSFIGFIPNNKWDYPQRSTTREEFQKIMDIIDRAIAQEQKAGVASDLEAILDELWDYLQTLSI